MSDIDNFARQPLDELMNYENLKSRVEALERAISPGASASADSVDQFSGSTGVLVVDELIAPAPDVEVLDPEDTSFYGAGVTGGGRTFGSLIMNFWAVAAGVLQVGFNNLGQLIAGAGAVKLDVDGIKLENDVAALFFLNNAGLRHMYILSDLNNNLVFANTDAGGDMQWAIKTTSAITPSVYWREDPSIADEAQFVIEGNQLKVGGGVTVWSSVNGKETAFNDDSQDIDF